jgi:phosphate transporter
LLTGSFDLEADKTFAVALDRELEKICSFYQLKESEIYDELESILKDEAALEHDAEEAANPPNTVRASSSRPPQANNVFKSLAIKRSQSNTQSESLRDSDDSEEEGETAPLRQARTTDDSTTERSPEGRRSNFKSSRRRSSIFEDYNDMSFSVLYDTGITIKKSLISIYVQLCELRSFIQLNRTGFSKVLKKYDKILDRKLRNAYIDEHVVVAYPFLSSTKDNLNGHITRVEEVYAKLVNQGKLDEARRELRLHLREHVVWERNTVWREMIGIERKGQAANLGLRHTILGEDENSEQGRTGDGDASALTLKELQTPYGRFKMPSWLTSPTFYTLLGILAVFLVLLKIPIMEQPEQQNCLAMVVFVSLLWATEVSILFDRLG